MEKGFEDEDDMFTSPSSTSQPQQQDNKSLYKVVDVGRKSESKKGVREEDEEEVRMEAAKSRLSKQRLMHISPSTSLTDARDFKEVDTNDPESLLDFYGMGDEDEEDENNGRKKKKNKSDEERPDPRTGDSGVPLEPLDMRGEIKRGEINQYGSVQRRKKRRGGEDDPSALVAPSSSSNNSKKRKRSRHPRLDTGMSSSDEDDEEGNSEDESEDEALAAEDPWLAQQIHQQKNQKDQDSSHIHSKVSDRMDTEDDEDTEHRSDTEKHVVPIKRTSNTLKSSSAPLNKISCVELLLKEMEDGGAHNETVLQLIKRLSPSSSSSNRKKMTGSTKSSRSGGAPSKSSKLNSASTPHSNTADNSDVTDKDGIDGEALLKELEDEEKEKKNRFEMVVSAADWLMDNGWTNIYQADSSSLLSKTPSLNSKTPSLSSNTQSSSNRPKQGAGGYWWQYKWTSEADEIFGPFDTNTMISWAPNFIPFPSMVVRGFANDVELADSSPTSPDWEEYQPAVWTS